MHLFVDDMTVNIENPKDKEILEIIRKVAGYKINIQNQLNLNIPAISNRKLKLKKQYHLK